MASRVSRTDAQADAISLSDVAGKEPVRDWPIELRPPISALTAEKLMERARQYRRMAATATTPETRDALNRLAIGFAMFAARG
jgi:hypothetical protein